MAAIDFTNKGVVPSYTYNGHVESQGSTQRIDERGEKAYDRVNWILLPSRRVMKAILEAQNIYAEEEEQVPSLDFGPDSYDGWIQRATTFVDIVNAL